MRCKLHTRLRRQHLLVLMLVCGGLKLLLCDLRRVPCVSLDSRRSCCVFKDTTCARYDVCLAAALDPHSRFSKGEKGERGTLRSHSNCLSSHNSRLHFLTLPVSNLLAKHTHSQLGDPWRLCNLYCAS